MIVDITYVIDHGYTDCIHNETEQLLLQNVRSRFVPWSLTERGLQAGLLMAACRSLLTLHPENETYKVSLLKYKSECIEILRAALSNPDRCISDYTIALALVLSTEEVSFPTKAIPVFFVETCSLQNEFSFSFSLAMSSNIGYMVKQFSEWFSLGVDSKTLVHRAYWDICWRDQSITRSFNLWMALMLQHW